MNNEWTPWKILSATLSAGVLTEGWNLADAPAEGSEEARVFSFGVVFAGPFATTPVVQIGLTGFDIDQRDGARIAVTATDISPLGFTVHLSTWRESRVYSVDLAWLAIGA